MTRPVDDPLCDGTIPAFRQSALPPVSIGYEEQPPPVTSPTIDPKADIPTTLGVVLTTLERLNHEVEILRRASNRWAHLPLTPRAILRAQATALTTIVVLVAVVGAYSSIACRDTPSKCVRSSRSRSSCTQKTVKNELGTLNVYDP